MKTRLFLAALIGLSFVLVQGTMADDKEEKVAVKCPVSGQPAKEAHTVDYKGRKIQFCCPNCPKAFTANPEKFAAKAAHQLALTKQATQVCCPLTGKPAKESVSVDVDGVKVALCCNGCKGKATKADDAVALIFGAFDKGFTVQTVCPVSGKAINVKASVDHDGKKVYFCCEGCPAAFKKDPAKFLSKLPQFSETK